MARGSRKRETLEPQLKGGEKVLRQIVENVCRWGKTAAGELRLVLVFFRPPGKKVVKKKEMNRPGLSFFCCAGGRVMSTKETLYASLAGQGKTQPVSGAQRDGLAEQAAGDGLTAYGWGSLAPQGGDTQAVLKVAVS